MKPINPINPINNARSHSAGQALIEIFFVVILFMFVGMMAFETGVLYYNVNIVSNALKQAAWQAASGATDEEIMSRIQDADTAFLHSVFFDHTVDSFAVEVWVPGAGSSNIALPPSTATMLTPGATNRAPYLFRANGLNIRVGLTYRAGYVAPYFTAAPMFIINLPLTASEAIVARNDEDRDGLVDLYEPEAFQSGYDTGNSSSGPGLQYTWVGYCHNDTWPGISDRLSLNIDSDAILDTGEAGNAEYDYDNDGIPDIRDADTLALGAISVRQNFLRHPFLGGAPFR